jgi:hypothetical protein
MGRAVRRCEKIGTDYHSGLPAKVRRFSIDPLSSENKRRRPMLRLKTAVDPRSPPAASPDAIASSRLAGADQLPEAGFKSG